MKQVKKLPLTDECHHWTRLGEVPWDLQKYWQQRYTIFPYYNEGIYMTEAAWYGVTPEPVANQIAHEHGSIISSSKTTVIDLFAGVGANAISLALATTPDGTTPRWEKVIAIELDPATLACAQHNASLHGVADDIIWVLGDSFKFLETLLGSPEKLENDLQVNVAATALFASPPWGGPGYRTDEIFDLSTMEPYNLATLHEAYRTMDHALYLPRTSDLRQVAKLIPDGTKIEVVQYCVEGASKALVAYIPAAKDEDIRMET
ncbi:RNA cap guanine-N2 methyltransferase-domain-containing protein [Annulohypoxylon maeteangense]|uniref:RNA cap guanine-N2 methyltransferase-domain-containing protein n=1 Tax=Annulohypoxylon maeteangense TaxID=1927788 RepID=UPI0020080E2B|nr:RNA cap guanine-N2 methyltransferase-domain-containing protein [Annulohypoxylon maeteangense]KAI0890419.1 RNA cap guanine-N2 methyltransferase-domain-containing protein [Annulohypoxylon maeteangense]